MKNGLVAALVVVAALLAHAAAADAQPVQLKFAMPLPPQSAIAQRVLVPWAEEVTKSSDGTVSVQTFPGFSVANLGNAYDRLTNGVIDITWGIYGPISSQFPKTSVVSLPFETRNGTEATLGLWGIYANGTIADEYQKVKLLAVATFPGSYPHFKKSVRTLADLRGVKISTDGRVISRVLEALGATPVAMPISETYQAAQRGTIDAIATAWPALQAFKLFEVVDYHLEVPIGNDPAFVAMNRDSYARLPEKGRAAIDVASYLALTKTLLHVIDVQIDSARRFVSQQQGHAIADLERHEEARWAERVVPVVEEWVRTTPDGAKVLAAYRAEIKKVEAQEYR
jgi:TRAP-type C4-dicarboxylate transport system substrate-binding protein